MFNQLNLFTMQNLSEKDRTEAKLLGAIIKLRGEMMSKLNQLTYNQVCDYVRRIDNLQADLKRFQMPEIEYKLKSDFYGNSLNLFE